MESQGQPTEGNTNDMDMLRKLEDEHLRLQRQFKAIHMDRVNRTAGVHPQSRRQDQLLRVLKKEYVNLSKDLKLASTGAHKKKDRWMKLELKKQLLLRNMIIQKHDVGTTMMEQLDGLLHRNNKHMLHMKKIVTKNMGEMKERRAQSEKRLVSTENRLEAAKLRFNDVQYENKKIREEIEHMLKDRALFNQEWNKMIKVLYKGKKFLHDLFESSTVAYDQRDEWVIKLRSVMEKGKVDQLLQIQEMRDLQRTVDHKMNLYHFLARKGVHRVNPKQAEKEAMAQLKEQECLKTELEKHARLLDDIIDYAEEENTDKIIDSFMQKEQENFSVYELLTHCCAENVVLQKSLLECRQSVDDRRDYLQQQEDHRQRSIKRLTNQLEHQRAVNERLRTRVAEKQKTINDSMERTQELFRMMGCSLEPYQNLLGDKVPSSQWQIGVTFSLMTERIKECLEEVYYLERVVAKQEGSKKKIATSSRLKKFTVYPKLPQCWEHTPITLLVPAEPCPACVETRWFSRVTDVPEVPFTKKMAYDALKELANDSAYVRSDRVHGLVDCKVPSSRLIMAARFMV